MLLTSPLLLLRYLPTSTLSSFPILLNSFVSLLLFLSLYLLYLSFFYITLFFILFLLGSPRSFYFQFPRLTIFCITHSIIPSIHSAFAFPKVRGRGRWPEGGLPAPTLQEPPEQDPWMCPPPLPTAGLCAFLSTALPMAQAGTTCHTPQPMRRKEAAQGSLDIQSRAGPGWGAPSAQNKDRPKSYPGDSAAFTKTSWSCRGSPWTHVSRQGGGRTRHQPRPTGVLMLTPRALLAQ